MKRRLGPYCLVEARLNTTRGLTHVQDQRLQQCCIRVIFPLYMCRILNSVSYLLVRSARPCVA